MPGEWKRVCSGPRFRYLENNQIEVEGIGIPMAGTNYWGDAANIDKVLSSYGDLIIEAAEANGVPPTWMLAIATVEGGWKYPHFINSAGAGGVMAMTPGAWKSATGVYPSSDDIKDPEKNIRASAALIRDLIDNYQDLPAVAASYNAGSPKCSERTRCKDTIDGKWTFDGTSAVNSFGMVEDCTRGRSSAYAMRAVEINNTLAAREIAGGGGKGHEPAVHRRPSSSAAGIVAGVAACIAAFFGVRHLKNTGSI